MNQILPKLVAGILLYLLLYLLLSSTGQVLLYFSSANSCGFAGKL